MSAQQGYIILACGARRYFEMARVLCFSLKLKDPKRKVCLACDKQDFLGDFAPHFDDVVYLEDDDRFIGCANKIRLYALSPYEETMYVDSDCLLMKSDMDRHWERLSAQDFAVAGGKMTSGNWYGEDIGKILKGLSIDYIVKHNSGVFFFRKGPACDKYFDTVMRLFNEHTDLLGHNHQKKTGQLADEPFFGAAMGIEKIEPVGYTPEEGSIMITTFYAPDCEGDFNKEYAVINKPTGFWILNRFLPKGHVRHTPSIMHFVSLKPRGLYDKLVRQISEEYNRVFPEKAIQLAESEVSAYRVV